MRRFMLWLTAALMVAGTALAAPPAQWHRYDYPELGFSVELPGAPTRSATDVPINATVSVKTKVFSLSDNATYSILVVTTDYAKLGLTPAMLVDPAIQDKLLEAGVEGALSNSKSVLVSKKAITLQGAPGREVVLKSKDGGMIGKFYFVMSGTTVYAVIGVGTPSSGIPPALERVWQSFRLTAR